MDVLSAQRLGIPTCPPFSQENKVVAPLWPTLGRRSGRRDALRRAKTPQRGSAPSQVQTHGRSTGPTLRPPRWGSPAGSVLSPARAETFLPLDVVPAIQDLLQQGHQGEGADEDEE